MDCVADMGGMHGFGPIEIEKNEPVFHAEWEKRTAGTQLAAAMSGAWIADECRHSMELMPAHEYLQTSYFEHWLFFLERLIVLKGLVTKEELAAGHLISSELNTTLAKVPPGGRLAEIFHTGGSPARPSDRPVRFQKGQRVRTRNIHPPGHTRLPRYIRNHVGTVIDCLGTYAFPDTLAHGLGETPQPTYLVRFDGEELWGPDCEPCSCLTIEMFDDYLDPAP